jgi:biopolymer transport protein TolR
MGEINVVPYIDVMLVLLIIFMVTAPLLTQGIKVDLPQTPADPIPEAENREPLVLSIDAEGRLFLNIGDDEETPLDERTVTARAAAVLRRDPETPMLVKADRTVPHGVVVRGMALLQQAGAPSIGIVTEPQDTRQDTASTAP